jgi:outer membrane biosynthesis protein TonB
LLSAASELDDFLFAETAEQQQPSAGMVEAGPQAATEETVQETKPQEAMTAQPETASDQEKERAAYPNPAPETPETSDEAKAEAAQPEASSPSPAADPLAPLRALSEAQKIALFS